MKSQMIHEHQRVYKNEKTGYMQVETINNEPSMAQQQFKDECDINTIMKRYEATGQITHLSNKTGVFADFSEITDYQGMLETVNHAQDAFMSLPANVRSRFQNNPGELLQFLQDNNNYDEGVELGLINPKIKPNPNPPLETTPQSKTKTKTPTPKSSPTPTDDDP